MRLFCMLLAMCASALSSGGEVVLLPRQPFDFVAQTGARGDRWLPETMGGGVVIAELNGDEWLDVVFLDGRSWEEPGSQSAAVVYLGAEALSFERLDESLLPGSYAFGGAAADLDGDERCDLILTTLDGSFYLRGRGDGSFDEALRIADGWGSSVCLLDFDADGALDVFLGRYVEWSPSSDLWCTLDGSKKSYCTPEVYAASSCVALRNLGGGEFAKWLELTDEAKALGVVAADMNDDGWTDVLVASDTTPDLLYWNDEGRRFMEDGLRSGMALSSNGRARAGMGIDVADLIPGRGLDLAIGHFAGEAMGVYRNAGTLGFLEEGQLRGLDAPTRPELTFGLLCIDLDLDGRPEIVTANGHIEPEIHLYRPGHRWKQRLGVYTSKDGVHYAAASGSPQEEWVGRGLAHGDFDADGDADLILTQNGGSPILLENRSPWERVAILSGLPSGSTVWLQTNQRRLRDDLRLGNSYLSCSEAVLRFGLAEAERIVNLDMKLPGGTRRTLEVHDDGRRILEVRP